MAHHQLSGQPPVPLVLRRSPRARRISLRVSRLDGRVTLTLPPGVPETEALAFAEAKSTWIRGHLAAQPAEARVGPGVVMPVEGQMRQITETPGRAVRLEPDALLVPARSSGRRIKAWLTELARDRLVAASDSYARTCGRDYARITLRDTRSRWGSCTAQGNLMYSWRLIMAPPQVLQYVAAHEVAHLVEMNHSPAFWSHVERLYGAYDAPRRWLRENGGELHRYRFD